MAIENTLEFYHKLQKEYTDFKIKQHGTGWIEIITPFWDISNDAICVYIKDNVISDDGNTFQGVSHVKPMLVRPYIESESKYWNNDLVLTADNEIIMQNFTPERLMPFIQLLIKIQGIIENAQANTHIRTLTEEQKNQLAMMCRKEQKVPEDFDDYFMENLPKMLSRTGEKNED